jgi:hypothetical protein
VSPAGALNFCGVALGAFADQTFTVQNTVGGTVSGAVSVPAPFSVVSGSPFNLVGLNATQTVMLKLAQLIQHRSQLDPDVEAVLHGGLAFRQCLGDTERLLKPCPGVLGR